jgi:hypothetical protein
MPENPIPAIEKTLTDVDGMLRRRLKKIGLGELDHIIMTMAPDGAGIIRSNCDAEGLCEMEAMLIEIANQLREAKLN